MKVLVLSNLYPPDFVGGYEIACAQVVDALRDRGHDVRVLTGSPRLPIAESASHVLRRFKLVDEWSPDGMRTRPIGFRLDEAESRIVSAHNVYVLGALIEEFAPDVVYVHCVTGLGGLALMASLQYMKVPWVWQLGDRVPFHLCSTELTPIPGLVEAFCREIRGHYIVVSEQLRRQIESAGIALNGEVEILPNGITGTPEPENRAYYRGGHLRIMSAGQINRTKGIDLLIGAAAELRARGIDEFTVDLYGKLHEPDLARLIQSHGLGAHVRLMGARPHAELLTLYRQYDVFAFPTLHREPFGLVALEAAARGCVPVMTHACGISEWLVHGVHCLKAERKAESFARVFAEIVAGRIRLAPIARRGKEVAWRQFHLDAIVPRIERSLARAAGQPRVGGGSAADAYRMARIAEQLTGRLITEALSA